eukprot:scaffold9325_cov97-Isochrysis_galbana.AAC.3
MLESLFSRLLARLLSHFVEGLTVETLQFGVWAGDLLLTDLRLLPDALDSLHLPLAAGGRIGRLRIRVPWTRLLFRPVRAPRPRPGLFLLADPAPSAGGDLDRGRRGASQVARGARAGGARPPRGQAEAHAAGRRRARTRPPRRRRRPRLRLARPHRRFAAASPAGISGAGACTVRARGGCRGAR